VVAAIIATSIVLSLRRTRGSPEAAARHRPPEPLPPGGPLR
jgi:hypothetical protein